MEKPNWRLYECPILNCKRRDYVTSLCFQSCPFRTCMTYWPTLTHTYTENVVHMVFRHAHQFLIRYMFVVVESRAHLLTRRKVRAKSYTHKAMLRLEWKIHFWVNFYYQTEIGTNLYLKSSHYILGFGSCWWDTIIQVCFEIDNIFGENIIWLFPFLFGSRAESLLCGI